MTTVLWRQFKDHSGCLVRGDVPVSAPSDPNLHLSCAVYLTAQVEAPYYGLVQSYDGAGISAGLLHNILVNPGDMSQGSLGKLTRRVVDAIGGSAWLALALAEKGWTLAPDGTFKSRTGGTVSGADLRNWVSPPNGVVPKAGADWNRAVKMAGIFHDIFSDPKGFRAQEQYAMEWLAAGNRQMELAVYQKFTGAPTLPSALGLVRGGALPDDIHVAMSVYHSFSVNSPASAAKALAATSVDLAPTDFAKKLIRELGTHCLDKWRDGPGDGDNRYDRTRVALWKREDLFPGGKVLMPQDL
jgi:hypothetical protein